MEGQFLPAMEKMHFLILQDGIISLILSSKEGEHFDPMKLCMKKGCQGYAS